MKIVHLIKATRISGAERHLLILCRALRALDVDARLVVLVEPDTPMKDLLAEAAAAGIPAETVVIHHDADVTVIGRIRATLNRIKPDILHTHLIHADTYGLAAHRLADVKKLVVSRHNDDDFRKHFAFKNASRMLWQTVDAGIAISDHLRQFVIETEGAPAGIIHTVRYGIDFVRVEDALVQQQRQAVREELGLDAGALIVGMACRLTEQKGVTYGVRAFASAAAHVPEAVLLIAGDGELREALEAEVRQLGLRKRVQFLGWRDDMPRLMAAFDVFLMPSLWEGFGLVLLEAMSLRVPVIASDVSAIPEVVVQGQTGYLVPPADARQLAQALQILLQDHALRAHMGLLAEDRVEQHFLAARMAKETLAIYQMLVPKTGKKRVTIN